MAGQTPKKRTRGRPRNGFSAKDAGTVKALDRGMLLLETLANESTATLTELALKNGMPPSSAHRLLITMQNHGFVDFDETSQEWRIGIEAFRIGSSFLHRTNLLVAGRDAMRTLMESSGETANLGVADNGDVVFVSQIETHQPIRAFFRPGARSPMHVSGIGKAMMAEMPKREVEKILQRKGLIQKTERTLTSPKALFDDLAATKARGWSLDDEEAAAGMRCVAAPIFNNCGEAVAGISVSGPTVRLTNEAVAAIGPEVRRAAAQITTLIGGAPSRETALSNQRTTQVSL